MTAGVSAAHVGVLAVLVTGAPGEDGGTEAGQLVIHGADPEGEGGHCDNCDEHGEVTCDIGDAGDTGGWAGDTGAAPSS